MLVSPDVVVRSWFKEVWNEGNESAIDRLLAPNGIVHGLGGEVMLGPAQFKPYFRTMRGALTEMEIRVTRTVVENDLVAAHCHVTARHTGSALDVPATGRTVDFWGFTMARVVGGQMTEGWNVFDFLEMYRQVGLIRQPKVLKFP